MDQISNMLTIIRNAQAVKKETVSFPYSKIKMQIAEVLLREKLIVGVEKKGKKIKTLDLVLGYSEKGKPSIEKIKRISKPSQRIYIPFKKIRKAKIGSGIQIISTPKGLLTGKEAWEEKVGGEIICEIL